jgi:hypothetical protein
MNKFVYHGTSRHDWHLIAREGLLPQEPEPSWRYNWPDFDTREPRIYGTHKLSIAKKHVDYPDGVVLRMLDDSQWNATRTGFYDQVLWRTTRVSPDQIKALLPNGKRCPLSEYKGHHI